MAAVMGPALKPSTLRFYKERMLRVLVHIQENLAEPLPLEKLASLACLAPHHFHHVFTGMLGEPLGAHIRLRLERAAWRLKLSSLSVMEIALEAGFDSHEAFARKFKGTFKMSPTQYRKQYRRAHEIFAPNGVHYRGDSPPRRFRTQAGALTLEVTIKRLAPMRVAFMRHIGPYPEVGQTWEALTMALGKEGWIGGDSQFLGICYDDPAVTPAGRIRYDACVTVGPEFQPRSDIGVQVVAGGEYALLTHFGPYEELAESYAKLLGQWLPRSGRRLATSPCLEVYLNSPEDTDPEDLITDLYAPLEPSTPNRHAKTR
jgi:AraC family transcriptional regulator